MQKAVENGAGIYRTNASLEAAAQRYSELKERLEDVTIDEDQRSHTFNTELTAALELGYMLDVAQTIVDAASSRHESRGAHQRTTIPNGTMNTTSLTRCLWAQVRCSSKVEEYSARNHYPLASGQAGLRKLRTTGNSQEKKARKKKG